ncbi:hypothetical protein EIP91_002642 [Steccherinum ochraceum]|uniref:DUF6697 domain-containing protein n=1 Tax=Steccherinum ochraceum TaxID=92696 RepID=A0A4R0RTN1_9APHY|nr:hypothetical protein EIP91_002642 [Steccherinum ochraceum]
MASGVREEDCPPSSPQLSPIKEEFDPSASKSLPPSSSSSADIRRDLTSSSTTGQSQAGPSRPSVKAHQPNGKSQAKYSSLFVPRKHWSKPGDNVSLLSRQNPVKDTRNLDLLRGGVNNTGPVIDEPAPFIPFRSAPRRSVSAPSASASAASSPSLPIPSLQGVKIAGRKQQVELMDELEKNLKNSYDPKVARSHKDHENAELIAAIPGDIVHWSLRDYPDFNRNGENKATVSNILLVHGRNTFNVEKRFPRPGHHGIAFSSSTLYPQLVGKRFNLYVGDNFPRRGSPVVTDYRYVGQYCIRDTKFAMNREAWMKLDRKIADNMIQLAIGPDAQRDMTSPAALRAAQQQVEDDFAQGRRMLKLYAFEFQSFDTLFQDSVRYRGRPQKKKASEYYWLS